MIVTAVHLKLTKFTRRTTGPQDFWRKTASAAGFIVNIVQYNVHVIRYSQRCLRDLAARNVRHVSIYGERHIAEVLQELALRSTVRITAVYVSGRMQNREADLLAGSNTTPEKVIVASIVDIDAKKERLRRFGIGEESIVVLDQGVR